MSATYRQESIVRPTAQGVDPGNRWLSRAPRIRLPAELIRDQALSVSGLLRHRIGGPSVSPYQPGDLWGELSSRADSSNWTAQFFVQSHGDDLYRRGLYTFWKRTCPPVQLATFDAPDRETCIVRRARTNTPLQALILMNDPTYLEAARKFAERGLQQAPSDPQQRLNSMYQSLLSRSPTSREAQVLLNLLKERQAFYEQHPDQAEQLLKIGESTYDQSIEVAELAGWTTVASAMLNLDEAVTRN